MVSRTTLWRRKKRVNEALSKILTRKTFENWISPTLCESFAATVVDTSLEQALPSDILAKNTSTMSSLKTVSSIEMELSNAEMSTTDDYLWFEEDEENTNVCVNIDLEPLFGRIDVDDDPSSTFSCRSSDPSEKELAAAIVVLKTRHRISIKCIDHICRLVHLLKIPHFPSSFARIKRLLLSESLSSCSMETVNICPTCCSTSSSSSHCDNAECIHYRSYAQTPLQYMNFPILSQLREILARTSKLNLEHQQQSSLAPNATMRDIYDGEIYRRITRNEQGNFLSLIMNVDGIQIAKSSSSSLWIVTFAINEIKRNERFKMKNIIIGGILSTESKPNRDHMRIFLQPIVKELLQLEKGESFEVNSIARDHLLFLKIFLIASCCDKPAQSLVQGISEPTGAYGCGRCELQGITVVIKEKSQKKIRVFPVISLNLEQPRLRTNQTYDAFMAIDLHQRATNKTELRDQMRGHISICVLRDLTYFDIGTSFVSDSLHNIYHGVVMMTAMHLRFIALSTLMVRHSMRYRLSGTSVFTPERRLLDLWFEKKNRKQPWCIVSKIHVIDRYLSSIKYPSTTARIPRSIFEYNKFKANELRAICLFGFSAFCAVLPVKYARHFLMLVIAVHLAESRSLDHTQVEDIRVLLDQFLRLFPVLYTPRQNTQAVHSLQHIAASVHDFGSLSNYSTFNFESVLGMITSTIHSTRRHSSEIHNNLKLLRLACIELDRSTLNTNLKEFIQIVQSSKRSVLSSLTDDSNHVRFRTADKNSIALADIQTTLRQTEIKLYKSCYVSNNRFTTMINSLARQKNDSCVLFTLGGKPAIGFIANIICTIQNELIFRIHRVVIKNQLYVIMNNKQIMCPNVLHGDLDPSGAFVYVKPQSIIEKLIYVYDKRLNCYIFFRVPNLCESS